MRTFLLAELAHQNLDNSTMPRRIGVFPRLFSQLAVLLVLAAAAGCPGETPDAGPVDTADAGELMLVVSEVMAKNDATVADEHGEFDDWIELYNPSAGSVSLAGYTLSDSASDLQKFAFADDARIDGGGYMIVWADDTPEQGPLHAPFKLKAGGEAVYLATAGEIVGEVTFGALCADATYGIDAEGRTGYLSTPTPGTTNSSGVDQPANCPEPEPEPEPSADGGVLPAAEDVVVNEVVSINASGHTDQNGAHPPWLELFNASLAPQDLTHHALSDSPAQPIGWVFPDDTVLAPGAFLVVFLDGNVIAGPSHSALIARPAGGFVALMAPGGDELARLEYPALTADAAFGLDADGQAVHLSTPTPNALNSAPATGNTDAGPLDATDAAVHDGGTGDGAPADGGPRDGGGADANGGNDAGN